MTKVSVKICVGTTCFVMGGADLQELIDIIPKKYGDKVEVESSNCLKLCPADKGYAKAPYVKIDEEIIQEATIEKILETIERNLVNS